MVSNTESDETFQFDLYRTGSISPGQSGSGINDHERVLLIPLSSMTRASPSDGLVYYLGHLLGRFLLLSRTATDWAAQIREETYNSLESCGLLLEERKLDTNELLRIE